MPSPPPRNIELISVSIYMYMINLIAKEILPTSTINTFSSTVPPLSISGPSEVAFGPQACSPSLSILVLKSGNGPGRRGWGGPKVKA